ncbi:hypothetical protein CDD82_7828 [Ophiocordyceps australis]|uniref:MalT-like TPR region domain-containing protein n=1 Tax=Ophiocordyceps australis TaxID=1399860 RepID=A0A2C5YPS6_9HYPO|nr:hypothetical protein CDD82_7828 [Ophiocordyceps australis]
MEQHQQQKHQQQQQLHAPADDYPYRLGSHHRPIATASKDAQRWFDRGLIWCYGFNHEEAVRCFEKALEADAAMAMSHWGLAYALGPNYNKPWDLFGRRERQATARRTHQAVDMARQCASSPLEVALADALAHRYPCREPPVDKDDVCARGRAYADAMLAVARRFPDDLDVAALSADALMNLTPWKLWDICTGRPAPGARTLEAKQLLEEALARPGGNTHAGLLHFYIHLMEMSQTPEAALPAADALGGLVPDAGHLQHMPSHIYILVGAYAKAIAANTAAIAADDKFAARHGAVNFYTLYRSHDVHFRMYAAMLAGQARIALESADLLEATITDDLLRIQCPPMALWLEAFVGMRLHVLIRFGHWHQILALPLPADTHLYCVSTALTLYARGVAQAALGRVHEAHATRRAFAHAVLRVSPHRTLFNNRCLDILAIAAAMLDGELEYRRANFDLAFAHLRQAIALSDALPFDEPWGWMQPVRHAYGALLLEQGRVEQALAVYRADLGLDDSLPRVHRHVDNVWSLHGYHECLVRLHRHDEARAIELRLRAAQAVADVPITSSCHCRRTKATDHGGEKL